VKDKMSLVRDKGRQTAWATGSKSRPMSAVDSS